MAQSFSLTVDRCASISDPALREEIQARTESTEATSRILRSIDRFGSDPSIQSFEMTPKPQQRLSARSANALAWSVRAVRLQPEAPAETFSDTL